MDTLRRLQTWYANQCNGDWEHTYGVKIDTLDNPGWTLEVDLAETALEHRSFEKVSWGDAEEDAEWLHCRVESGKFHGACGSSQLGVMLEVFLVWAEM
jgi:hypothetical protein